jgi:hypothetical protein
MSELTRTVSQAEVVSTFGTSFWVRSDSAVDYFLHPAFLRFVMLSIGVYALMDQSNEAQILVGWQHPVMWLATALTVISGLILMGGLALQLHRRGILRRIYTPFLMLPIIILAEVTEQSVLQLFQAGDWKTLPQAVTDLTRDMMVIMLLDVMHALYVVPNHPRASLDASGQADAEPVGQVQKQAAQPVQPTTGGALEAPVLEKVTEASDRTESSAEGETVRIADRNFPIGDIQSIRTEDHYLNVVTRASRSMLRAKLSDLGGLHDGRHGVQINRSQWVSFAAIASVIDEENGQVTLHLANGDSATVSRTRRLVFMQLFNSHRARQA